MGSRRLGGEALDLRALKAAGGLARLGVGEGDTVAILMRNDIPFMEMSLACGVLGAYSVPINWHFTTSEAEHILVDSGAKVVLCHADLWPVIAPVIRPDISVFLVATPPDIQEAYGIDSSACGVADDMTDWETWVDAQAPSEAVPKQAPSSMIYTSGTTGNPKGVRREPPTPQQAEENTKLRRLIYDFRPEMCAVMTGPLYHSAPNVYSLFTVRVGGTLHLMPRFDAEELLRLIDAERVTHGHVVPTMFIRLLALPDDVRGRYDVSSLQRVVHGAAPCPIDVKRRMIDWWGPVITEYYGGTETGPVTFCHAEDWLSHPGTVGRAAPNSAIEIVDEDGALLPPNEIGEIFLRIWSYPDFTYQNNNTAREDCERDGLVSIGDVGHLDDEGYLYLSDRKRDMVISGGVNIYPVEIEHVLVAMPGVHDCAVFGIPNAEFGESLAAAVQIDEGVEVTEEQIRDWLGARLSRYKIPRVFAFHEALPREETGKIYKRKLREPYWVEAGRQI